MSLKKKQVMINSLLLGNLEQYWGISSARWNAVTLQPTGHSILSLFDSKFSSAENYEKIE